MRLIDADALKKHYAWWDDDKQNLFDSIVDQQPTVDAAPVKGGKWIDDGQYDNFFPHHEWRCSECGEHVLEIGVPWFKYCPNCGARMEEE